MSKSKNLKKKVVFVPSRIVSGGQTGVDRAALEVAIALGIDHGGWCPAGRRSEDGSIPSRYNLVEHDSPEYPPRTRQNVLDSDATLILYERKLRGGTLLTRELCKKLGKPHLVVAIDRDDGKKFQDWLRKVNPASLNVAGPRESTYPGITERATAFLLEALSPIC